MSNKQKCRITGKDFEVPEAELLHIKNMSTAFPGFELPLPLPTIHPLEQLRRMFSFTNYHNLHHEKSSFSGKPLISRYDSKLGTKLCTVDEFWSDKIDNLEFGRAYDFSRPFFEQWKELYHDCYMLPLNNFNAEGSLYVNGTRNVKDCYLCFNALESRDCLYSLEIANSEDCISCTGTSHSQYCYNCLDIEHCYECQDSQDCKNSSFCIASLDLIGSKYCFGCVGLRNQEYCIFNEAVGEKKYKEFISALALGNFAERLKALAKAKEFIDQQKHQVNRFVNTENSSGNYLRNCKNVFDSYFSENCEDCGYLVTSRNAKNCWRGFSLNSELNYLSMSVGGYYNYCSYCGVDCRYLINSFVCVNNCEHCFGCVALKGNSYCILNKQYSKKDYFELLPRIIEQMTSTAEWGEFFPPDLSPYNVFETKACEYFDPLSEIEFKKRGYRIEEIENNQKIDPTFCKTFPANIQQIDIDQILNQTFCCEQSGRPFKYQKKELIFLQRNNIPLPHNDWKSRLQELFKKRVLVPAVI